MNTVMKCVFGSHLYGVNTPASDTDIKGVFIPSREDLVLQRAPRTLKESTSTQHRKNTADDVDHEMFALHYFMELLAKGETVAIDMIHCPDDKLITSSPAWEWIREHRQQFYTTKMHAYLGYVKRQASKYGVKGTRMYELGEVIKQLKMLNGEGVRLRDVVHQIRPSDLVYVQNPFLVVLEKKYALLGTVDYCLKQLQSIFDKFGERARLASENQGVDWKAMSHAIRAGLQLKEIYSTGDLQYPLKDRELILQVKLGKMDLRTEVEPLLIDLIADVDTLATSAAANGMRSEVDRKMIDTFVFCQYNRAIQPNFWEK